MTAAISASRFKTCFTTYRRGRDPIRKYSFIHEEDASSNYYAYVCCKILSKSQEGKSALSRNLLGAPTSILSWSERGFIRGCSQKNTKAEKDYAGTGSHDCGSTGIISSSNATIVPATVTVKSQLFWRFAQTRKFVFCLF